MQLERIFQERPEVFRLSDEPFEDGHTFADRGRKLPIIVGVVPLPSSALEHKHLGEETHPFVVVAMMQHEDAWYWYELGRRLERWIWQVYSQGKLPLAKQWCYLDFYTEYDSGPCSTTIPKGCAWPTA